MLLESVFSLLYGRGTSKHLLYRISTKKNTSEEETEPTLCPRAKCMHFRVRIPRPIASQRHDEACHNLKATSNAPSVSQENEEYI